MPGHLIATIGLPGCGKTTRAREFVAEDPGNRVRLNRDDYRDMMFGGFTGREDQENAVTAASAATLRALLADGFVVVCDDTNLRQRYRARLVSVAAECGAIFTTWDMTDVPLEECIARDYERGQRGGRFVGPDVITSMHEAWRKEAEAFERWKTGMLAASSMPVPASVVPTVPTTDG